MLPSDAFPKACQELAESLKTFYCSRLEAIALREDIARFLVLLNTFLPFRRRWFAGQQIIAEFSTEAAWGPSVNRALGHARDCSCDQPSSVLATSSDALCY